MLAGTGPNARVLMRDKLEEMCEVARVASAHAAVMCATAARSCTAAQQMRVDSERMLTAARIGLERARDAG
ncbi:hypothetical protein ABT160_23040 [Streptomyces sp. NPDC001941]|uniref:hypothetical protein n=1 Tax=Streptomyces sp. NPDC001941 TaxID=3154659 RepID=UPI00332A69EE